MDLLWLGYNGLTVRCADVTAVLFYHPVLNARIIKSYGRIPANVQAIVVMSDGTFFPSSWSVEHLRQHLTRWYGAER